MRAGEQAALGCCSLVALSRAARNMTEFSFDLGAIDAPKPDGDVALMRLAIGLADSARTRSSPNPWVGAVVLSSSGEVVGTGATAPVGGPHAEVSALQQAGEDAVGGTLAVTLEPCCHVGRTPPCTNAIIASGISRVIVAVTDPDERVAGNGVTALRDAGIVVETGICESEVHEQLLPYLHHRRTGRPFVLAKIAATLDGHTAAADGSSQWITGDRARHDAHRLRAESDAVIVGAGTVRADDPSLTVRHVEGRDPMRVVLGAAPVDAKVHPCLEWTSSIEQLLDELGSKGCLQVLVEGGSTVLGSFYEAGLIDRWAVYLAPGFMGGTASFPLIGTSTHETIEAFTRGRIVSTRHLDGDVLLLVDPPNQERIES